MEKRLSTAGEWCQTVVLNRLDFCAGVAFSYIREIAATNVIKAKSAALLAFPLHD